MVDESEELGDNEWEELSGDDLDGGDLGQKMRQEQLEEVRNMMGRSEAVRIAEHPGEELGSELNRGMWLRSEGRTGRNARGRDKSEIYEKWWEFRDGKWRK